MARRLFDEEPSEFPKPASEPMPEADPLAMLDQILADTATVPRKTKLTLASLRDVAPDSGAGDLPDTLIDIGAWERRRGEDIFLSNQRAPGVRPSTPAGMADFFAAAFLREPQLHEHVRPDITLRAAFIRELLDTADFKATRASCMCNNAMAEAAALSLANDFGLLLDKVMGRDPDASEMLDAVGEAAAHASDTADTLDDVLKGAAACGFGAAGAGAGLPGGDLDPKALMALHKEIRGDHSLQKLFELFGRFARLAQGRQRQKTSQGLDELMGVRPGGKIELALASELAKLSIPSMKLLMLSKLLDGQLLSWDRRKIEKVGKGPVIVTVDESSSTHGDCIMSQKALALTMAWLARQQKRWCGLVAYSGDCGHRLMSLSGRSPSPPALLLNWLTKYIGGGSHRDVPIVELPGFYDTLDAPKGRTDIVMMTDAICTLSSKEVRDFNEWKAKVQAHVTFIVIGSSAESAGVHASQISKVADDIKCVPYITSDDASLHDVLDI